MWLAAGVARDWAIGPVNGRVPAISTQKFCYAIAFLGAALLGSAYCTGIERFRSVFTRIAILAVPLSVFVVLQVFKWDVKSLAGWSGDPSRPSGIYTNANRFAVLMSCCWMCGCAVLLHIFVESRGRWRSHFTEVVVLGTSVLAASVCIALTLSRLTMVATAVALMAATIAYILLKRSQEVDEGFELPLQRRLAPLMLPLVLIAGWGAWCLMVGNTQLRNRFADLGDSNPEGRVAAISAALPLLKTESLWGHGLGLFESVFTAIQPASLAGRWREVHSDWVQLAIEAGVPAAVFAATVALCWLRGAWKKLGTQPSSALMLLFGAAGIAIVMICSAADFPLREPATAMLIFFIAGALCGGTARTRSSGIRPALTALLAILMLAGAFVSGRSGLAYAQSPWLGKIFCPENYTEQLGAWDKALALDSGDPEILFRHACALFATSDKENANLPRAREAIQAAQRLQSHDYRFPLLEASIAEFSNDLDAAVALRDRASLLAPVNPDLRDQNGRFYLRQAVVKAAPGEELHEWGIEKALENFRALLQTVPSREGDIIARMSLAGCLNTEIAQLWPGSDEQARLKRALFFCSVNQWDMAERQLEKVQPSGARETAFIHAIRGTLALKRRDQKTGMEQWKIALSSRGKWTHEIDGWLASQTADLKPEICEAVSEQMATELAHFPALSGRLAAALASGQRFVAADRLLEKVAVRSPELSAQWADLALQAGDEIAASDRARMTYERGGFSPRWAAWYEQFRKKLGERKGKPSP